MQKKGVDKAKTSMSDELTVPPPNDRIITFSVRIRESQVKALKQNSVDRGLSLQEQMEQAVSLYLAESTQEKRAALSPFPDARPDEIDMLQTVLAAWRTGPADVKTILRGITKLFRSTVLKKSA